MEKILTKEEIDALVAAVFSGTLVLERELHSEKTARVRRTEYVVQ
ncbi:MULTISPECIES: hypothetical protein [Geomonas]|jgi:hypothetical protein|nr:MULTISPECIES: hypothetical protein [Geomonas]